MTFPTGQFLAHWWVFPASCSSRRSPSQAIGAGLLKAVFGVGLLVLGGFLVFYDPAEEYEPGEKEGPFLREKNTQKGETVVEITTTQLIVRCRLPPRVAVATSVFVLAVTAIAGALVHALSATPVWYVVAWSIPGVLLGSAIGTRVAKYVPSEVMEPALGVVFGLVGVVVLVAEFVVP